MSVLILEISRCHMGEGEEDDDLMEGGPKGGSGVAAHMGERRWLYPPLGQPSVTWLEMTLYGGLVRCCVRFIRAL